MGKNEARTLVVLERPADLTTPVAVMRTLLSDDDPCFLLESVEGGARVARWSFLGTAPERSFSGAEGAPFALLRGVVRSETRALPASDGFGDALPPFIGGAVGFAGYDAVRRLERIPSAIPDVVGLPDAWFGVFETVLAFDHVRHRLLFLGNALRTPSTGLLSTVDGALAAIGPGALRRMLELLVAPGAAVVSGRDRLERALRSAAVSTAEVMA